MNQAGTISVTGGVGITPLQANIKLKLKMLPIVPLTVFQDSMALLLTSGHVVARVFALPGRRPHEPRVDVGERLKKSLEDCGIDVILLPVKSAAWTGAVQVPGDMTFV